MKKIILITSILLISTTQTFALHYLEREEWDVSSGKKPFINESNALVVVVIVMPFIFLMLEVQQRREDKRNYPRGQGTTVTVLIPLNESVEKTDIKHRAAMEIYFFEHSFARIISKKVSADWKHYEYTVEVFPKGFIEDDYNIPPWECEVCGKMNSESTHFCARCKDGRGF